MEVISAIIRRINSNSLSREDGAKAITRYRRTFDQSLLKIEMTNVLIDTAARLAENHALRAYDAVQLAAALEVHSERAAVGAPQVILISADNDLNIAALNEGLLVDNPNLHP